MALLLLRGAIPHASALGNPTKPKLRVQDTPSPPHRQNGWRPRKMSNHSTPSAHWETPELMLGKNKEVRCRTAKQTLQRTL